jgi:hypothetical protein
MENIGDVKLYKNYLEYSNLNILENFMNLVKIYDTNVTKNNDLIQNISKSHFEYFYFRGINALLIIFVKILKRTNNLKLTYFHTEKAIYYYIEFFYQISNRNSFISLTCNDAILFLYKKTIYKLSKFNPNLNKNTDGATENNNGATDNSVTENNNESDTDNDAIQNSNYNVAENETASTMDNNNAKYIEKFTKLSLALKIIILFLQKSSIICVSSEIEDLALKTKSELEELLTSLY